MIKMRLQGSRNDIRWFLKILDKDDRFDVFDTSAIISAYSRLGIAYCNYWKG